MELFLNNNIIILYGECPQFSYKIRGLFVMLATL